MEAGHEFLELLGLDGQAAERDIRRAYAVRLKRIDQEADPAGFQRLRAAYETALGWAAWKARQDDAPAGAPAEAPEAPQAPATESAPQAPASAAAAQAVEPAALAQAVFHRLTGNMPALVEQAAHPDAAPWKEELARRLDDEELVNIDARVYFEAYVASILAQGWRAGHEHLFVAAQEVFGWKDEPRRLQQFGQTGALLNQALVERQLFAAQPAADRVAMRKIVDQLRRPNPPAGRIIMAGMRNLERMLARFPALMRVSVGAEQVEAWRATYRRLGGKPVELRELPEEAAAPPAQPEPKKSRWRGIFLTLILIAVLRAMFNLSGGETEGRGGFIPPTPSPAPSVSQSVGAAGEMEGRARVTLLGTAAIAVADHEELKAHIPPIVFTLPRGARSRSLDASFRIFLDHNMRVGRVQNLQTSSEPAFDTAVRNALLAAKPFMPGTPSVFDLRFDGEALRAKPAGKTQRQEQQEQQQQKQPRPQDAKRSGPSGLELLRTHVPPIRYQPSRFAKEGKLTVRHKVFLDAQGRVVRTEVLESSGEPRFDRAAEEAMLAAKPFPDSMPRSFDVGYSSNIMLKPKAEAPQQQRQEQEQGQKQEQERPSDPAAAESAGAGEN